MLKIILLDTRMSPENLQVHSGNTHETASEMNREISHHMRNIAAILTSTVNIINRGDIHVLFEVTEIKSDEKYTYEDRIENSLGAVQQMIQRHIRDVRQHLSVIDPEHALVIYQTCEVTDHLPTTCEHMKIYYDSVFKPVWEKMEKILGAHIYSKGRYL